MSSDTLPIPEPSENAIETMKRKLQAWWKRAPGFWRALWTPAKPPPGNVTAEGASASANPPERRSGRAQKRMVWITGTALFLLALGNQVIAPAEHGALWRVLVAIIAFLYIWWLGSVLFDLVFIWHRYIEADAAHHFLRHQVQPENFLPKNDPPTDEAGPGRMARIPPSTPRPGGDRPAPKREPDPVVEALIGKIYGEPAIARSTARPAEPQMQ
jgi:hypothetical protein